MFKKTLFYRKVSIFQGSLFSHNVLLLWKWHLFFKQNGVYATGIIILIYIAFYSRRHSCNGIITRNTLKKKHTKKCQVNRCTQQGVVSKVRGTQKPETAHNRSKNNRVLTQRSEYLRNEVFFYTKTDDVTHTYTHKRHNTWNIQQLCTRYLKHSIDSVQHY